MLDPHAPADTLYIRATIWLFHEMATAINLAWRRLTNTPTTQPYPSFLFVCMPNQPRLDTDHFLCCRLAWAFDMPSCRSGGSWSQNRGMRRVQQHLLSRIPRSEDLVIDSNWGGGRFQQQRGYPWSYHGKSVHGPWQYWWDLDMPGCRC